MHTHTHTHIHTHTHSHTGGKGQRTAQITRKAKETTRTKRRRRSSRRRSSQQWPRSSRPFVSLILDMFFETGKTIQQKTTRKIWPRLQREDPFNSQLWLTSFIIGRRSQLWPERPVVLVSIYEYIYIYICMYIFMYKCIYIHIHKYIYICAFLYRRAAELKYSRLQIGWHTILRLFLKTFNSTPGVPGFSLDLQFVPSC